MVKQLGCFLMWTRSLFLFLLVIGWQRYMYVLTSSADNGQVRLLEIKELCAWKVFYSMEPVIHEQGFQLYFKTSRDSCESKRVTLELFQAKWSNLTKCLHKDDLIGIHYNKTQDHNFWYTNLEPGNYCVLIKPLARTCNECHPSFTGLITLLPSQYKEVNRTTTQRASSLSNLNATSLYIAVGGVLLISIIAFPIFLHKRSGRIPQQDEKAKGFSGNELNECTCGSREALLETEVFILHTRDAWNRSSVLCQTLNDLHVLPVSSTLVSTLRHELFTPPLEQIAERIAHVKVIVVESDGALQIHKKLMEEAGISRMGIHCLENDTRPSQRDELDYMDQTFLNGLASIISDPKRCFWGYDRVFVVRFPCTPRELKIAQLVGNIRFTLPKDFPELCWSLLNTHCRKCLQEKRHVWKEISDDGEFQERMSRETPTHNVPV